MAFGATGLRRLMNFWPPFRGAGIRVREIAPDFRRVTVELRMKMLNRNYVGTHFGGSLYSMTDPFFMIMMMNTFFNMKSIVASQLA
jgi:acyl-coenzyme A thioesterase PaaI-like protein